MRSLFAGEAGVRHIPGQIPPGATGLLGLIVRVPVGDQFASNALEVPGKSPGQGITQSDKRFGPAQELTVEDLPR
jgi:hypothetical protein